MFMHVQLLVGVFLCVVQFFDLPGNYQYLERFLEDLIRAIYWQSFKIWLNLKLIKIIFT